MIVSEMSANNITVDAFVALHDQATHVSRLEVGLADVYLITDEQGEKRLIVSSNDNYAAIDMKKLA